jgi:hypothetical protein
MSKLRVVSLLAAIVSLGSLAPLARAQSSIAPGTASPIAAESTSSTPDQPLVAPAYQSPTEKTRLRTYLFDAFGPYPIVGSAFIAAVNQREKTPPEWGQGAGAYGQRFGSNFAIAAVTTTTRYGLARAFGEDTVYYRCECKGILQRFRHAMISTVTARRGADGHRRLSFPAIAAPYAGTMTAVYAWYPGRFDSRDAFRMGNYTLLAFAGENLALEFIYGGPHTLFSHLHRPAASGTDASSGPSR